MHRRSGSCFLPLSAVLCGCLLASCHPAHKAAASKTVVHNDLCAEAWLEYPNQPHPMWEEVKSSGVSFPDGFTPPKRYTTYRTNSDTLAHFFRAAVNASGKYAMILPVPQGCEAFIMKLSGAMSPGLRARYPDIISLQGNGTGNKTADLRLDWSGETASGQLMYNGAIYLLMPARAGEDTVYVLYAKDDAGAVKQPFEGSPGNRDRPEMRPGQPADNR